MIAPSNRLLLWAGLVFLPASLIMAVDPGSTVAAVGTMVLFALAALADALTGASRLERVVVSFEKETLCLTKGRKGELPMRVATSAKGAQVLRIGLAFPPAIISEREFMDVLPPEGAAEAQLLWPCAANERGNFLIENIYLEIASPLGFWRQRATKPAQLDVCVYPNLMGERNNLAAIFLNRGNLGIHAVRQVGKGRDFEQLRQYIPGDSMEDIHWKATARRGHPITKVYQVERTQEVYVVIDASRLSARGTVEPGQGGTSVCSQLERFITAAMVLGLVAEKQGDHFGVLAFSDKVHSFVRAKTGTAHFNVCRDALHALQPRKVNPDYEDLCSFIRLRLRRRALLIFLTNLDDPILSETFVKNLELLTRHHLMLVNMITPPNVRPLFSNPDIETVNDVYTQLGGHVQWHNLREVQRTLHHHGVSMNLVDNAALCPELVSQYVNVKQRQLL